MRFRKAIMIAAIILWPIAVELTQRLALRTAAITIALVISSFIFYVCCAVMLRSSTSVGALCGAIFAWLTVETSHGLELASVSMPKMLFYAIAGAIAGWLWEFSRGGVRPA